LNGSLFQSGQGEACAGGQEENEDNEAKATEGKDARARPYRPHPGENLQEKSNSSKGKMKIRKYAAYLQGAVSVRIA